MKRTLIALALFIPAIALAAGTAAPVAKATHAKAETGKKVEMAMKELTLTGGTDANRIEIENAAKSSGAEMATFDPATGVLKFHGKKFNEKTFEKDLGKVAGVAIKK